MNTDYESAIERAAFAEGVDYALSRATSLVYSATDEPEDFAEPNLSGEWADDPTPNSLARDFGVEVDNTYEVDVIAAAWEDGVAAVWDIAIRSGIARVRGEVEKAIRYEVQYEKVAEASRPEHVWQRGHLSGNVTCERCHLLPLDVDDTFSPCSG